MLERLPIALAQVKLGNTSENLLNGFNQTIYSMFQAKAKAKKKKTLILCNNIINLINLWDRIDTIFMNSEDSKVSNPHILLLSLSDKMNLKKSDKYVAFSNLRFYYTWTI